MLCDLIILRGIPGAGKTTLAALLSEEGKYPVMAIDDYFTDAEGNYQFRYQDNHLAYKACEEKVRKAMTEASPKIFIDNVFSLEWEMEPYFKLASEFSYRVHVLTVENRHGGANVHGIDREALEKMAAKFKVVLL